MWVEHSFGTENGVQHGPEGVEAHFLSLRDGRPLTISMHGTQVSMHTSALQCVCVEGGGGFGVYLHMHQ